MKVPEADSLLDGYKQNQIMLANWDNIQAKEIAQELSRACPHFKFKSDEQARQIYDAMILTSIVQNMNDAIEKP